MQYTAPPSKSLFVRAVVAASYATAPCSIDNPNLGDDGVAALEAARSLGADVHLHDHHVAITPRVRPPAREIYCGESALLARVIIPLAATIGGRIHIAGSTGLQLRPLGDIEAPLRTLGVHANSANGYLPLVLSGVLHGGTVEVNAAISSQFVSGLLMALPLSAQNSTLRVKNLVSLPYITLTLKFLRHCGIEILHDSDLHEFQIRGGQSYRSFHYSIEGDWSAGAFLLVAAALAGGGTVHNLAAESAQGDRAILDALRSSGCSIRSSQNSVEVGASQLQPFAFDAVHTPDLIPPLVALAARCQGISTIQGVHRLYHKESDRAHALIREFRALGIEIEACDDALRIRGSTLRGGQVSAHRDHRIAMALAVSAIGTDAAVMIDDPLCVAKSFPDFWLELLKAA